MASRELTARFRSTCSIWPGSAFTSQRSDVKSVTRSMSSPMRRRSIFSRLATRSLRLRTSGASNCLRLKARSWRVNEAAFKPACLMSRRHSWAWCDSRVGLSSKSSALPAMTVNRVAQPVGHLPGRDAFKSGTDGGKGCVGRQGENNVTRGFHEQTIAMLGLAQQVLGPLALGDVNQGSDKAGDFAVRIALGDRLADDPHHRAIGTEKAVLGVIRNAGGDRGGPAGHDPAPVLRMQGRRPA